METQIVLIVFAVKPIKFLRCGINGIKAAFKITKGIFTALGMRVVAAPEQASRAGVRQVGEADRVALECDRTLAAEVGARQLEIGRAHV